MSIKLVAVDLDGTLLNERGVVSEATKAAIDRAQSRGVIVAFCTGRTLAESRPVIASLPQVRYAVTTTCGRILNLHTGEYLGGVRLEPDLARSLAERLREHPAFFAVMADGEVYSDEANFAYATPIFSESWHMYHRSSYTIVDDVQELLKNRTEPVEKLFFIFRDRESRDAAWPCVQDAPCYVACSGSNNIELTAIGADKGVGLKILAEHLGIAREETCACGDNINDLEMLQYAGLAVAMGNATPDTKKHADVIAPSNREDGVAWVLDHLEELACN